MASLSGSALKLAIIALIAGLVIGAVAGYSITKPEEKAVEAPEEKTVTVTVTAESEGAEKEEKVVTVKMRVFQWGFDPNVIEVEEGTKVVIDIVEVSADKEPQYRYHTFTLPDFGINQLLEVGKTYRIEFVADKAGEFTFECARFCGVGHAGMKGKLIVRPKGAVAVEKLDLTNLDDIKKTLRVLVPEEELPDKPAKWKLEDYPYLMVVVQREYPGGALKIINTRTLEDLGNIEGVGIRVHVVEFNHVEKRWAYSISRDGVVSKIDLFTLQVVRQVKVGYDSRGLALSEDGRYLAVGNYDPNTLVILDAYTLEPLKVIKVYGVNLDGESVESRVAGLAYARGYFVFSAKELGEVWVVEAKPPFRVVATLEAARILHEVNPITRDERYLAVTSQADNTILILDLEKMEIVKRIPTPQTPHPGQSTLDYVYGIWYANSVKEASITVIDVKNLELLGYIKPSGIDVSAGGGLFSTPIPPGNENIKYIVFDIVFGPHQGTLILVDRQLVAEGKLGSEPIAALITWKDLGFDKPGRILHPEYTYDGKYLVVSAWDHNKIIVLDATALPEVKIVKVFDAITPTGIFPAWRVETPWLG